MKVLATIFILIVLFSIAFMFWFKSDIEKIEFLGISNFKVEKIKDFDEPKIDFSFNADYINNSLIGFKKLDFLKVYLYDRNGNLIAKDRGFSSESLVKGLGSIRVSSKDVELQYVTDLLINKEADYYIVLEISILNNKIQLKEKVNININNFNF